MHRSFSFPIRRKDAIFLWLKVWAMLYSFIHKQNKSFSFNIVIVIFLLCVHLVWLKKPTFFTLQLFFAIIHESHYTFLYYSWVSLSYFSYLLVLSTVLSTKSFQFQLNKLFPNRHYITLNMLRCKNDIYQQSSSSMA